MKIQFDSSQDFQRDAINAVVGVFEGQPLAPTRFEMTAQAAQGELVQETGVANNLRLTDAALLANVKNVQAGNGLGQSAALGADGDMAEGRNFSVEMETGTGKTYVYLRTVFELNARYGFTKFVIVVPSVAIREGVLTTLDITREHFAALYPGVPADAWDYSSAQASRLRSFAGSTQIQILVMNIQAIDKAEGNVINQEQDRLSGRRPIDFVRLTHPIVILDEPQNMEGEKRRDAIQSLNPLCTLRYSATHTNTYNLLYRLDPVKAYDLRLVKRIEVDSVLEDPDFNRPYVRVLDIKATKSKVSATLELDVQGATSVLRKRVSISRGDEDLFTLSGGRAAYQGYRVSQIDAANGYVEFENGISLSPSEAQGARTDDVLRYQIQETIKEHLEKELAIAKLPQGERLKVLSLFFIDRVAHYKPTDAKFRVWFEAEYARLAARPRYQPLGLLPAPAVHDGYFAEDKTGAKDTNGKTQADDAAYKLIMRDKERLLDLKTPLRFIFSHSALREGWDNPNVFQICTLREIHSEKERRQTIGRGLRLPVRENGERSFDPQINRLTVIADESYDDFAKGLQNDLKTQAGVDFTGRLRNARERKTAILNKQRLLDPEFQTLWRKISAKTRYRVAYDTAELVTASARLIAGLPRTEPPSFRIEKKAVILNREAVTGEARSHYHVTDMGYSAAIPDLLGYLQRETELTRATLAEILIRSGKLGEAHRNPQQFLDNAAGAVKETLHVLMVQGIKYERIAGAEYEMRLFERELSGYSERFLFVDNGLYDVVEYESNVEYNFAKDLSTNPEIKIFFKLPDWFTIDTPLGTYNPDWAIVKHHDETLYLVRETKGSKNILNLPEPQRGKVLCGTKHFQALGFTEYKLAETAGDV